jgi:hypothetical protein
MDPLQGHGKSSLGLKLNFTNISSLKALAYDLWAIQFRFEVDVKYIKEMISYPI